MKINKTENQSLNISPSNTRRNVVNEKLRKYFSLEIKKVGKDKRPDQVSYHINEDLSKLQNIAMKKKIDNFISQTQLKNNLDLESEIDNFKLHFKNSPISSLKGGSGFNNSLMLYLILKITKPDAYIESGIWRGFSNYIANCALKDSSNFYLFDIDLSNLEFTNNKWNYYESDISQNVLELDDKKVLAFFDDHVSHYERLQYCMDNSVDIVILDDNVSVETVYNDRYPPIPTANMIFNYEEIPHNFSWISDNKLIEADISNLKIESIKSYYEYYELPNLINQSGFDNYSYQALLIKK